MGLLDFLITGGSTLLGVGATGKGLKSAFADTSSDKGKEEAGNDGIDAGMLGVASGFADSISAVKDFGEAGNDTGKKWQAGLGGLSGVLGMGASIADIFGGMATKNGDEAGQKRAGIASGILGGLGGLATTVQSIIGIKQAGNDKAKQAAGWSGLAGGLLSALGGAMGAYGSAKESDGWQKAGAVSSALGSAGGWIGNIASLFAKDDAEQTATA